MKTRRGFGIPVRASQDLPRRFVDLGAIAAAGYAVLLMGLALVSYLRYGDRYWINALDGAYAALGALFVAAAWKYAPRLVRLEGWRWNLVPALFAYGWVALGSAALDAELWDLVAWRSAGWPLHYADLAVCAATDCSGPA